MRDLTLGRYYEANSFIHNLDARTKLFFLVVYIAMLFIARSLVVFLFLGIVLILLFKLGQIPFQYFIKGLKPIIILLIITFLFRSTIAEGQPLFRIWIIEITKSGIYDAARITSRIGLMVAAGALVSYTATPKALSTGMWKSLSFLSKIGIPTEDLMIITLITFRFLPVMNEELNNLMDAQMSRGVEFQDCSIYKKCKNMLSLAMPLFINAITRSENLAIAMEARGFESGRPRGEFKPLKYSKNDYYSYGVLFAIFVAVVLTRFI